MDGIVEEMDPELRDYFDYLEHDSDNSYYSENEYSDLEGYVLGQPFK